MFVWELNFTYRYKGMGASFAVMLIKKETFDYSLPKVLDTVEVADTYLSYNIWP